MEKPIFIIAALVLALIAVIIGYSLYSAIVGGAEGFFDDQRDDIEEEQPDEGGVIPIKQSNNLYQENIKTCEVSEKCLKA